jgi:cytohesin
VSIPISFLSLAFSSIKLFFYQRLGHFSDSDPKFKLVIFVSPFVVALISGPLFCLVLIATYFHAFVLLTIFLTVAANFVVLTSLFRKRKTEEEIISLYKNTNKETIDASQEERGLLESNSIFFTSVLTSWISPCLVWTNNIVSKSFFLLASSITTNCCYTLSIVSIFIYINMEDNAEISKFTMLHCIQNETMLHFGDNMKLYNLTLALINICLQDDICLSTTRVCARDEFPTDLFNTIVGPIGLVLILISFGASVCLQLLSNYHSLYKWSKKVCCSSPLIHVSHLYDFLKNYDKVNDDVMKRELYEALYQAMENDVAIISQRDPINGNTLLHAALDGDRFEVLEKLVKLDADFSVKNTYGEDLALVLKRRLQNTKDPSEKIKIENILKHFSTNRPERFILAKERVWKEQPMLRAVLENKLNLLCFLSLLGGHWGAENEQCIPSMNLLMLAINTGEAKFENCNFLVRWRLINATDGYGQTIIHNAAKYGMARCLEQLTSKKKNVDIRKADDGRTPLFYAVQHNKVDCAKVLIAQKADVNAKGICGETPLHLTAQFGAADCAGLLLDSGAVVDARARDGSTPLQKAASFAKPDCLRLLVERGADVNVAGRNSTRPLHCIGMAFESNEQDNEECCRILIDSGAKLNLSDDFGRTPLIYATNHGFINCAKMLVDSGADVQAKDNKERTVLHYAARFGQADFLQLLIGRGADVNARDEDGQTPLHVFGFSSAGTEDEDCCQMFVRAGADLKIVNKRNERALNFMKILLVFRRRPDIIIEALTRNPSLEEILLNDLRENKLIC